MRCRYSDRPSEGSCHWYKISVRSPLPVRLAKLNFIASGLHHNGYMPKNKTKKESGKAILASVKKEMAEPRMVKSAREEDVNQTVRGSCGKRLRTRL